MPEISIIVPVYKTEEYLPRCIDSILAQTFSDFELLLIDDGSPDNSGKICDEYAARDSRIRVFHKENGGVSSARNMGLDNAIGTYIGFVDSDDYILPGMYETLYKGMTTREGIGMSSVSFSYTGENAFSPNEGSVITAADAVGHFYSDHNFFLWDKLYSSSVIGSQRFDRSIRCGEDGLFLVEYAAKIDKVHFAEAPMYVYCVNEGSITQDYAGKTYIAEIPLVDEKICGIVKRGLSSAYGTVMNWAVNDVIHWLDRIRADQALTKQMNKNAFPLRKSALKCRKINYKVRILFFFGYYGRTK